MYFPHLKVDTYYLILCGPLLPVPDENMLPFLLVSGREGLFMSRNMTVSSRAWLSENSFLRVLVDGSLFHQVLPFRFRGGWLWIR